MDALTENWDLILSGFGWTLRLLGASAVIALVVGTIIAVFRVSPVPVLRSDRQPSTSRCSATLPCSCSC